MLLCQMFLGFQLFMPEVTENPGYYEDIHITVTKWRQETAGAQITPEVRSTHSATHPISKWNHLRGRKRNGHKNYW